MYPHIGADKWRCVILLTGCIVYRFNENKELEIPTVTLYSEADIPTCDGDFHIHVFKNNHDEKEHFALTVGNVKNELGVLVRVHSECMTGETLGSLRCDCREQLHESMRMISKAGRGIIIYLRQEGRGIGLGNKVRAYDLQDAGIDTYEANHQLGFHADERDYSMAVSILKYFGVKSLLLITNNPEKIRDLREHGIEIIQRVPIEVKPNKYSQEYLRTKRDRAGHLLDHLDLEDGKVHLVDIECDSCQAPDEDIEDSEQPDS
jgi:GTP cyclohydrolase II